MKLARVHRVLMVAMVAVWAGGAALLSDRVPVNNGFGWDGETYAMVATDPVAAVRTGSVDQYRVHRILPSAVVYLGVRAFGLRNSPRVLVDGFEVLNVLLLVACALLWVDVAETLALTPKAAWLGWTGLFVNFAVMRQASYYAVLTDTSAYALGLGMLMTFLRRRSLALAMLGLAGSFVWPTASALCALLLTFPRRALPEREAWGSIGVLSAVGAGGAIALLTGYFYYLRHYTWEPGMPSVAPLSIALAVVGAGLAAGILLRPLRVRDITEVVRSVSAIGLLLTFVMIALSTLLVTALSGPKAGFGVKALLSLIARLAIAKPLNFFIPHVIYFGPFVLVTVYLWPHLSRVARELGLGFCGLVMSTVILGMTSESRQLMLGVPFLVAATAVAAQQVHLPSRVIWWVAGTGLVFSKFWMPMPIGSGPTTEQTIGSFPMQWYYMNHGPWISVENYLLQTAAVTLVAGALFLVLRERSLVVRRVEGRAR